MNITRAHINKDQTLTCSYDRTDAKGIKWTVDRATGGATIHGDLIKIFNKLAALVAIECKFAVKDDLDEISITCINWMEKKDTSGVIISGTRRCKGRAFNFNTPYIRLDDETNPNDEKFKKQLSLAEYEAREYINGNKWTMKQAKLDLEEEAVVEEEAVTQ